MNRTCERCGKPFQAKRTTAKYCGSTCRSQASTIRADGGPVVRLAQVPSAGELDDGLVGATRRTLDDAGVLGTVQAQAALILAARVVAGQDGGSAMASMVKQLEASVSAALASVTRTDSMDEVQRRRDQKLRGAGAS